ncbi:MAG TPA: DUF4384 domain-containing protein, partial [Polyangiaceae bacterium]|nr:DUF4384 domain-containing protein [Polyangiaceae bacterium]
AGPTLPPPPPPEQGEQSRELEQGHLLLFPSTEPERLLARPVRLTEDGAWTIADARSPGCEVEVRTVPSKYRIRRRVKLESLTAFSGTFGELLGIEAGFGSATEADIDIENSAVLKADTRGDCDQVYVDQVFVGTGRRKLLAKADAAAKASLIVPGAPGAGVDSKSIVVDETAWESPQAYAFTYREAGSDHGLALRVEMPTSIVEGQEVTLRIESDEAAYLVVYYRDAAGKGAVLWPSHQEQSPMVRPGAPAFLPSASERSAGVRLQAALVEPGQPARETLIVYGFRDQADYARVSPPPGASFEDGTHAAAHLTAQMDELPLQRWTRSIVSYLITPKEPQ